MSQQGVPYRFARRVPGVAFDCSGLTNYAWGQAGVDLPHQSAQQYASTPHVPKDQAQPGDLIFYYSPISHVGIYIGGGMMVHAPSTGNVVKVAAGQLGQGRRRRPPRLTVACHSGSGCRRVATVGDRAGTDPRHRRRTCHATGSSSNIDGAVGAVRVRRSSPAGAPTSPSRVTDADGTQFVLRRPPLGHVLATAHDMAREHRIIAAVGTDQRARPAGARAVHRRRGQRRAVLRDGLRRRRRARQRRQGRGDAGRARRRRRDAPHRRARRSARVDVDAVGPRRPRQARGLHRAPGEAVEHPVGALEDPRAARHRRGRPPARERMPAQHGGRDRPRRLPVRQLPHRRRAPAASPRCSTGSCARSAIRWPTSATSACTGSTASAAQTRPQRPDRVRRASRPTPTCSSGTPPAPVATCRRSTTTSRSRWRLAVISEGVYARYLHGAMGDQAQRRASTVQGRRRRARRIGPARDGAPVTGAAEEQVLDGWERGEFTAAGLTPSTLPPRHRAGCRRDPRDPGHHAAGDEVRQRRRRRRASPWSCRRWSARRAETCRTCSRPAVDGQGLRRQGVHALGARTRRRRSSPGCAPSPARCTTRSAARASARSACASAAGSRSG